MLVFWHFGKNSKTLALLFNLQDLKVQENLVFLCHQGAVCLCLSSQQAL